nr:hypothetical protein [Spirochaetota bacterium]
FYHEKKIKSPCFDGSKTQDGMLLRGRGWGHGVGLCQWGANGMAERKASYDQILRHYYRGTRLMVITGKPRGDSAGKTAGDRRRPFHDARLK